MARNEAKCSPVLAKSVNKIIELYMPDKKMLYNFTANEAENNCFANALEDLLQLGTRNVITMRHNGRNLELNEAIFQKPNIYISLGIDLPTVLESLIAFGKIGSTCNPRGLYISIAQSKEEAASFMTNLWKKFVYKVIVLVSSKRTLEAYTWRPYHPPNNCGPLTAENTIKLGKFTDKLDQFEKESDTKPGILPGKYVYNTTDEDENAGIEVSLIEMVCKRIGIIVNTHYRKLTLLMDENEAWAGSIIPKHTYLDKYEISVPYIQDAFVWIVPIENEIRSVGLADGVSLTLWTPSFLAMMIISVSLLVVGNRQWVLAVSLSPLVPHLQNLIGFLVEVQAYFNDKDVIEKRILEDCKTIDKCYEEVPTGRAVFTAKMHADYLSSQKGEISVIADQVPQLPTSLMFKVAMIYEKGHAALAGFDKICH